MESMTSIQVSKNSKKIWNALKNHPGESFEAMINRMINILNEDDSKILSKKDIMEIEQSISDFKNDKYVTNDNLKKKYGL